MPQSGPPLLMAYYPDWIGPSFPPEKIDFGRFDWVDFAFAVPDSNFNITWDNPDLAPNLLSRLVTSAHSRGKHVKLSVGGWTGSKYASLLFHNRHPLSISHRYFSPAVATDQSRQAFVTNILALYDFFNLDGIELDWEYPGQEGNQGNLVDPNDSSNFLLFLQLLRKVLPPSARITAATQPSTFVDSHGQPLVDVSVFASVLNWILVMNYDAWGCKRIVLPIF